MLKKLCLIFVITLMYSVLTFAGYSSGGGRGGFSSGRGFSASYSARSYASPSRSYSYSRPYVSSSYARPSYNSTTVINNHHGGYSSGFGHGFMGGMMGAMVGSSLSHPYAPVSPMMAAPATPLLASPYGSYEVTGIGSGYYAGNMQWVSLILTLLFAVVFIFILFRVINAVTHDCH